MNGRKKEEEEEENVVFQRKNHSMRRSFLLILVLYSAQMKQVTVIYGLSLVPFILVLSPLVRLAIKKAKVFLLTRRM